MNKKWIFGASLLLLGACGDSEKKAPPPQQKTAQAEKKAEPKKEVKKEVKKEEKKEEKSSEAKVTVNAAGEAELTIEATDAMQYTTKKFTVTAGQKVKLTLKHIGKMPKDVMGHNVVILKAGVDVAAFAGAAQVAAKDGYIPKDKADQILAHTSLIGGGESATVEFVAPEPGTYTYICSYSGHWYMMKGEMVVKAKA